MRGLGRGERIVQGLVAFIDAQIDMGITGRPGNSGIRGGNAYGEQAHGEFAGRGRGDHGVQSRWMRRIIVCECYMRNRRSYLPRPQTGHRRPSAASGWS